MLYWPGRKVTFITGFWGQRSSQYSIPVFHSSIPFQYPLHWFLAAAFACREGGADVHPANSASIMPVSVYEGGEECGVIKWEREGGTDVSYRQLSSQAWDKDLKSILEKKLLWYLVLADSNDYAKRIWIFHDWWPKVSLKFCAHMFSHEHTHTYRWHAHITHISPVGVYLFSRMGWDGMIPENTCTST